MLLIITHENIGERMAGPSIRSWEIAQALGRQGAQVRIISPFASQRSAPNVDIVQFDWAQPGSIVRHIDRIDELCKVERRSGKRFRDDTYRVHCSGQSRRVPEGVIVRDTHIRELFPDVLPLTKVLNRSTRVLDRVTVMSLDL